MNFFPLLTTGAAGGSDLVMIGTLVVVMIVFYVFIFRKQGKEQKQHDAMVSTVEVGDSVLTSSGFYGVIRDVSDEVVIVEFGNNKNCRIPMKKSHIAEVEKADK